MPANLIKSLAAKGKASESELEKYWKEAKDAAKEGGKSESDPLFFGLVTKIFKAKVKKHLGIAVESMMHFKDFLMIEKFVMEKKIEKEAPHDSIMKFRNADTEPIIKKGVRNPPEFKANLGDEELPDKIKKKLK